MLIPKKYPVQAPPWLHLMPTREEAATMFGAALRRVASRLLERLTPQIAWNADGLSLHFGQNEFRYSAADGRLTSRCSCGGSHCLHEFLAYAVLRKLSERHRWPYPTAADGGAFFRPCPPTPALQTAPPAPPAAPARVRTDAAAATWDSRAYGGPLSSLHEGNGKCRVVAEVDFHNRPGWVFLRCYRQRTAPCRQSRDLLLNVTLYKTARFFMERGNSAGAAAQSTWCPDEDAGLLLALYPFIDISNQKQLGDTKLELSDRQLLQLRRDFAQIPGRFINRDSQRPLPPPGQYAAARLFFTLSGQGAPAGKFRLRAMMELPGKRICEVCDMLRQPDDAPDAQVTRYELFATRFPVSREMLVKHFSRPVTTIRKELAASLLPQLFNGHLELLQPGGGVRIRKLDADDTMIRVSARLLDRSAFSVRLHLDNVVLPFPVSPAGNTAQSLSLSRDGYMELLQSAVPPIAMKLGALLQESVEKCPGGTVTPDGAHFPASTDGARHLREFWQQLPSTLKRSISPEVSDLLNPQPVKYELSLGDSGIVVEPHLLWQAGNAAVLTHSQVKEALRNNGILLHQGHWLYISPEEVTAATRRLTACGAIGENGETSPMLRRTAHLRLAQCRLPAQNCAPPLRMLLAEELPPLPPLSPALRPVLRDYQREGFLFLADRILCGAGALLADDMGLGKTLQVLALLQSFAENDPAHPLRAIVVCPAAVTGVWMAECARFSPHLRAAAYLGTSPVRAALRKDWKGGLLVTHYGLVRSDMTALSEMEFDFAVLDEAQYIKNPHALTTIAVKRLQTRHRIALTGTPLENRLLDLWSIMDFLNPGLLGEADDFQQWSSSRDGNLRVQKRIAPLMLRRTKDRVAAQLPPRTVNTVRIAMTPSQREAYDREVVRSRQRISIGGTMEILAALMRLRQLCCDMQLGAGSENEDAADMETNAGSAKMDYLMEQCAQLTATGHSVLVFSQFVGMLKRIRTKLDAAGIASSMITGETPIAERSRITEAFNDAASPPEVMLLSLKAAGTGLTLTKADYVFLFDPWWNPAVENQAIDRTHRIGQTRPVFAYRLVAQDSVEERVLQMLAEKQQLFDDVIDGAAAQSIAGRLDRNTLLSLL